MKFLVCLLPFDFESLGLKNKRCGLLHETKEPYLWGNQFQN